MQRQNTAENLVESLHKWKARTGYSVEEIAGKAGIDVSTVYRIFDENAAPKKVGSGIKKICKIAKVPLTEMPASDRLPKVLSDAMLAVWDGSTGHALRLAAAITAIGNLDGSKLSWRREKQ